jgi:pyruvate dehydrogenase E2 component (dihydrolipoamide acetyltransferase)
MAHQQSADSNDFILPDLGEGVHEAELIKWRVRVGDSVAELDILAEMQTDKALVEVPSPRAGVIAQLHGKEGEILHVGNPLVSYKAAAGAARPGKNGAPAPAPTPAARVTKEVPEPSMEREDAGTVVGSLANVPGGAGGKTLATPAVRRLAKELGVDIERVPGTGIGGRVTEKDVRSAKAGGACDMGAPSIPPAPVHGAMPAKRPAPIAKPSVSEKPAPTLTRAASGAPDEVTRIPFRGVRRVIAQRLRESVDQAVHFTVMDEADVSALDSMRRKLAAASGEKVSFLPFVASAVCRVLSDARFRALNATTSMNAEGEGEITQYRSVHLGIATDTEAGLMVPVVRDADRLGVLEISRAISATAEMARNRSIPREQLTGSTFTISNVGSHAGRFATPIINFPEVGILAVGRGREGMVVNRGMFRVGLLLPLSLACDHRVVDGATAALGLAEIVSLLQDSDELLTPARS